MTTPSAPTPAPTPTPTLTPPTLSISIHISPPTHSFAHSHHPPTLHLTLTSHHPSPITIYADDLSPKLMIKCGAFTITDLTTGGTEIRQSVRTNCRIPLPMKVPVPLNEGLFHTLLPDIPVTMSAPFARSGGKALPLPRSEFGLGGVYGVDGLEPGHRYFLSLAGKKSRVCWNVMRWWEYGIKEQVVGGKGDGKGLDARRVRWGAGPHPAIVVDVDSVEGVVFECLE